MARVGAVIREVYHRPGAGALSAHLEDHYGIRVTGTAREGGPEEDLAAATTTTLAAAVRAHSGRPA
jgi:hypothetical protein